ncbi:MAG: type IV toxin-antitoxin system AbiEi family antitoxin domain-containing protein, partial [Acidimicrobiales bacterium]
MIKRTRELRLRFQTQHGVITRADALSAGLTDRAISGRIHRGEWVRLHAGVYRLAGAPETPEQLILGAVLACGPAAVASHQAAAWLWGLLERPPERPVVTIPRRSNPRPDGFDVHRMGPV